MIPADGGGVGPRPDHRDIWYRAAGPPLLIEIRPVIFVLGLLIATLGLAMVLPVLVDLAAGNPDWQAFAVSMAITLFVGLSLILTTRGNHRRLGLREMFLLTGTSWIVIAAFSALPFLLSDLEMSAAEAFFEATSGITTTGSTVITGLDAAPPGILFWRALLQFLGGIGIIVMAIAVLPNLQVGGMQLFRMESSDRSDKVLPRTAQNAAGVAGVYILLGVCCAISYAANGMEAFDAVLHAMTTVATGGFSTKDASLGYWTEPGVHWTAITFMLLSGLPFILILRSVRAMSGRRTRRSEYRLLFTDAQVRGYLAIMAIAVTLATISLAQAQQATLADWEYTLRHAAFNVVSVMTGTGYATQDYGAWSSFALTGFFFLMFVGGCAGSTTCGIKIFRLQVLFVTATVQVRRLMQPSGVFVPYYNGRPVSEDVSASVMGFFFLFILCYAVIVVILGLLGLDFLTAVSGAGTALANVGPGLGTTIGPASTFADLPDGAKWVLSAAMLLGRLELFTFLVFLSPAFWRY